MVNLTELPPPAAEAREERDEKRVDAATPEEENPSTAAADAAADVAADAATEEPEMAEKPEMAEELPEEENLPAAGQNTQSSTALFPVGNLERMIDDWFSAGHAEIPLRDLLPARFSATPSKAWAGSDSEGEEEEFASLEELVLFHVVRCRPELDVNGLEAMYTDCLNAGFKYLVASNEQDVNTGASRWLAMRAMWRLLGAPGTWPKSKAMPEITHKPYDRRYAVFKKSQILEDEASKQNKNSGLATSHWADTKKPAAPAPTTVAGTSAAPGSAPTRQQQPSGYHFPSRKAKGRPAFSANRSSTYPAPRRPITRMEVMLYDNFSARSKAWDAYGRLGGASYKFGAPPFEIELTDNKMSADLLSCRYNNKVPTALQGVNEYIKKIDPNVNLEFGHHRRGRLNMLVLAINSETRNEVMKYVGAVFEIAVAYVKQAQERRDISIGIFFKNREAELKAAATNPQGIARGAMTISSTNAAASSQDPLRIKMIEHVKHILKSTDVIKRGVAMDHFVNNAPTILRFESKDVPFGAETFAFRVKEAWAELLQPGSASSAASWYDGWLIQRHEKSIEYAAKEQAERERARSAALQIPAPMPPMQAPPTFPSVPPMPYGGHAWVQQQPAYPQSAPSWQQPQQPYQAPPAQWQYPAQSAQWQQQQPQWQQQPQQPYQQPYQSASAPWQQPPGPPPGQYYGPPPPGQRYPGQPPYH
ncbi:hypothetical protein CaCOL14_009922 [Colletotrichum acutatum]|uniref:Uncharacterized protein n=1 Tax=Glomerella acutata TaxID=27357 RepID=A0AAD8UE54_GLOAC|nr:uncharacterized protein BDZ83DRAFT_734538 [Colletotrichum acutatum]KAK1714097.1 hypothetical protein BDZ83DRAFT_734538 [Colletotrichum acutatum]